MPSVLNGPAGWVLVGVLIGLVLGVSVWTWMRWRRRRSQAGADLASERWLRLLFDTTAQLVGVLRPDGTLQHVNEAALELAGVRREAVLGQPFWACAWWQHSRHEQHRLREAIKQVAFGTPVRYDAEASGADGRPLVLDLALRPVRDADGRVAALIAEGRDVTAQRRARHALAASEARYQRLLDQTPDLVVLHRDGRIVLANPAALVAIGAQTLDDVRGRSVFDFIHPDDQATVAERHRRLAHEGDTVELAEERLIRLDGTTIDVEAAAAVVRHEGALAVQVVMRETTDQRRTEQALLASEQTFARIFQTAPVAMSISTRAEGRFLDVNDRFAQLLGYDQPADIVGRTTGEVGIYDQPHHRQRVLDRLGADEPHGDNMEGIIRTRTGERRKVVLSAEAFTLEDEPCILAMMVDVTDRRRSEVMMEMLKAFYEATLNALPIQVAVLDVEARFLFLNPAAMPDASARANLIGKTSVELAELLGYDRAPFERRHAWLQDVIANGEAGQLEENIRGHDGSLRTLLYVASPVLDDAGSVQYVVGYGMDVTERRRFEDQLLEAKERAEELARLKTTFLTNMSHEIRTPLTGIIGFASVLDEEVGEEHREVVSLIRQSGERLMETLNSVLDLARLEANAMSADLVPVDVGAEVLAAVPLFQTMAQAQGLAVHVEAEPGAAWALLDRPFFHRVLSNLLSNAIKFTNDGFVQVTVEAPDMSSGDGQAARYAGRTVTLTVEDTGVGIGEAFLPHLFDEFKQESSGLARSHSGSGLGLAITRRLVEQMQGTIEVESEKGRGTRFVLRFPAAPPLADELQAGRFRAEPAEGKGALPGAPRRPAPFDGA